MALILNLETATKTCSVALALDGEVHALVEETSADFSHAEKLNLFIQEALSEANKTISDLDAVAVSAGPGSYTGLRIGTSTAKGICYALDIPIIAINSLTSLASMVGEVDGLICPMFDARRMEVYTALYGDSMEQLVETNALVIEEDSFSKELNQSKIYFIGPGADKCAATLTHTNAIFSKKVAVSAKGMSSLSYQKYLANELEDLAYFEPAYLKDFVAGKPKKLL